MSELEKISKILDDHEKRISELEEILKKKTRVIVRKKKTVADLLIELKSEGFFKEKRTISQIRDALHTKGKIVNLTDLPSYLLRLVRDGELKRKRELVAKRRIWVYFA